MNGQFSTTTYAVGDLPQSLTVDDFNNDGFLDLIVANVTSNDVTVLRNQGNGTFVTFATVAVGTDPVDVATGDFNLDGFRDFATVNRGSNNVSILTGDGTGMFTSLATPATGASPRGLTVADFDRDGNLDIATANFTGDSVTLLLNQGGGTFLTETLTLAGTQPVAISSADFDLDGLPDLVLGLDQTDEARLMLNRGAPEFFETVNLGTVVDPTSVTAVDINGDGLPDVVATSLTLTNNVVVFLGNTTGPPFTMTTVTAGGEPQSLAVGDLNGDGRPDLITTNRDSDDVTGLVNLSGSRIESLTTGVVSSNVNFGNQQLALISGVKFSDLNSNGVRDTMPILEPGLSGVTVWLDLNSNGVRDPFEPMTTTLVDDPSTTGTDETGQYSFADVVPGPVRVVEVVQPGFAQTTQQMNAEFFSSDVAAAGDNAVDSLIADLDGDGRNDVVVLSQESSVGNLRVFAGTGTQHINLVATLGVGINPEGVAAADLDADGDLDLAVANSGSDDIQLFENIGNLTFVLRQTLTLTAGDMPGDIVLSDVNGDGRADVIVANGNSPSGTRGVSIFTNNNSMPGSYAFNAAVNLDTGGQTVAVEVTDLDNDGDSDIAAVVNSTNEVRIFENVGGSFLAASTVPTGTGPQAITISDFNRDGRADLVVGKTSGSVGIEFFAGSGLFQYASGLRFGFAAVPDSLAVADTNSDGLDDVVFTIPSSGQIAVLLNSESGFTTELRFSAASQITGVSVGDLDGDMLTDIVAVQNTTGADVVALFNRFGSIPLTLVAGQQVTGQDFGNVQLGTISGTKFHDIDLDGIQDAEEDGIQGLKIFLDLDGDGIHTPSEEPFTLTDQNGFYQLNNVPVLMTVSVAEEILESEFFQTFPNQFLLGDGVEFDAPGLPQETALGDLDGDGDLDVAVASFSQDAVLIGLVDPTDGTTTRIVVPVDSDPIVVRLADLNGDSILDIISASLTANTISVAFGNGNGTFMSASNIAAGTSPRSLAIGNFDGANGLDVAVSNDDNLVTILFNNGFGVLGSATTVGVGSNPREIVAGDFNGDSSLDLAVANSNSASVSILINDGSGEFSVVQTVSVDSGPFGLAVADFVETNAALDLIVVNNVAGTFQVLSNDGTGSATAFTAATGVSTGLSDPRPVTATDLDGDGNVDIVIGDVFIFATNALIGLGDGNGGFTTQTLPVGGSQGAINFGDVTGNGRPDVVVTLFRNDRIAVLPNLTGAQNVTLSAGETRTGVNFGNRALPGSVSGVKFRDDNENGVQDGSEPGLPGFTVFVDLDNDDVLDAGEPFAVTGSDGAYTISGLETLTEVTVSEVQQAGFVQTAPTQPSFAFSGDISPNGSPAGVVTGDFDGINGEDIAVTLESSNQVAVLLRQASGAFGAPTLISVGAEPFSIVTADFDGVNGLDLAVTNEGDGTVSVLTNNGSGVFTAQTATVAGAEPSDLAVADVDGMTGLDLVVTNRSANTFTVLLNNGSGVLTASSAVSTVGAMPSSVAVADIDQDGDQDVAVITSADNMLRVFLQGPIGTFSAQTPIATGTDPSRLRTGLLNNDLVPDLVVVNQQSNNVTVVLNNSSGTLNLAAPTTFATRVSGETLALADFNRDGFTDIVTGGEESSDLALLLNDGMGAFGGPILFPLDDTLPIEIAPITLNADGDIDLVITDDAFPDIVLVTNTFGSHTLFLGAGQDVSGFNFANRNINLAPVLTVPGAQTVDEDVTLTFDSSAPANAITIADPDEALNPGSKIALFLNVTNGTLTFPVTTGLGFQSGTTNGSSNIIVTGTLTDLNAALNGLQFFGDPDFNGLATLNVVADDLGNFGAGGPLTDTEVITINVAAVNDAPVLADIEAGVVAYTENDPATQITNAITVTDVDDTNIENATAQITGNYQTSQDVLSATGLPGGITANFNAVNGTLTLSGSASKADYQTALRAVQYTNSSESPNTLTRTVTFTVNDGDANSNIQTRDVTVTSVNDAPLLANIEAGDVAYTENDPATQITNAITVTDVDDTNIDTATVQITGNFQGGQDVLSATGLPGGITANFNTGNGTLTFSGSASQADYQTALRAVRYTNTSDDPNTATRTIAFTVNDGDVNSNTQTRDVTVAAVNDVPVLANIEVSARPYTENNPAAQITNAITVTDVDDTNIENATVQITGNFQTGQDVLSATGLPGGITANFNAGNGTLTFSGSATTADYQTALRAVQYTNTSDDPNTATRTIAFTVNDGDVNSNTQTRDVTVTSVNDAPLLANIEAGNVAYTENDPATQITNAITVTDVDDANIDTATVQITGNFQGGQDVLSTAALPAGITANFNAGNGTLTFSGTASRANYQTALRAVRYTNTSDDPNTATRTITFTVNDGDVNSNTQTRDVTVAAVNDAPVLANIEVSARPYTENDSAAQITNAITVSDLDDANIDTATVQITGNFQSGQDVLSTTALPAGIAANFNAGNGTLTFSGAASKAEYQTALRAVRYTNTSDDPNTATRTIAFTVNDGDTDSNTQTRDITVSAVIDLPEIANLAGDTLSYTEGDGAQLIDQSPAASAIDLDSPDFDGGTLTVSIPVGEVMGQDVLSIRDQGVSTGQIGFNGSIVTFEGTTIGTFGAGSIVVTFNANATLPAVSALLANITYENTSDVPSEANRTARFVLNDGDGGTSANFDTTIEVTAANDAPSFAGAGAGPLPSVSYTEGGPPAVPGSGVELVDPELDAANNWGGASLTAVRDGELLVGEGQNADDVFGFSAAGMVVVNGSMLEIGGVARASFTAGSGLIEIDFNSNARSSDVDAILQALTYQNVSDNPPASVDLLVVVDDGNMGTQGIGGALAAQQILTVNINAVNDAPMLAGIENPVITYSEGDAPTLITSTLTVTDVDDTNIDNARVRVSANYQSGSDVLAAVTSGTSITATFDTSLGQLNLAGSDTLANYQAVLRTVTFQNTSGNPNANVRTINFRVNDGDADSNIVSRMIDIQLRPAEVSGVVWLDTTEDGIRDDEFDIGEPRVQGVSVALVGPGGNVIASTTTNMDGEYSFSVDPARFRVVFTPPNDRHFTIQNALVGGSAFDSNDSDPSRLTGQTFPLGLLTSGATASNVDAGLVVTTVSIAPPALLQEGNAGLSTPADFTVSLNGPATRVVTVNVIASSRTATLGTDFEQFPAAQQTVTFQPGEVSKTATLNITGDATPEADEDFQATLSNPIQAVLGVSNAIATIFDDDMVTIPRVVIETFPAPAVIEGNPLDQPNLVFIARLLTGSADADIDVSFSTIDPMVDAMTMLAPEGQATPGNTMDPGDYTPVSGTVTIEAGQTSAVIQVQVVGDSIDEPNETVSVRLNSVSGANAQLGMSTEATGLIIDDDDPTPSISVLDGRVRELDPSSEPGLSFVLERGDNADLAITGTYRTVLLSGPGAAIASDFTGTQTGTFEIAAGATGDAIVVPVIGDLLNEGDETFGIELLSAMQVNANGSPGGSVIIARRDAIGTIDDDDDTPVLSLGTGARVNEGRPGRGNVLFVTVTASAAATTDITFTVSTIDQNAAGFALAQGAGVVNPDYIPLSNVSGVISAGLTSTTIPIQIIGDDLVEPDERVRVRLDSVGSNALRSDTGAEVDVTIGTDDRDAASLRLTGGQIVSERDGMRTSNLGFSAVIDAVLTRNVIVNYRTVPLPSDAGSKLSIPDVDYVAVNTGEGQTVILAGQLSAPISVIVLPDDLVESPLEDVFVEITSFEIGPELVPGLPAPIVTLDGLNDRAKSSIRDDDGVVTEISIAETTEVREGDVGTNPARAIVTLSSPASQDLRLTYRTRTSAGANAAVVGAISAAGVPVFVPGTTAQLAPDHEELTAASILIPRGSLTASVPVRVIGDDLFEGNEVFLIELTGVTLANGVLDATVARLDAAAIQSVVTILDDEFAELPELSFAGGMVNEGDPGDDVDAVFTLSLSGRIQNPVEIRVRTIVSDGVGLAVANADLGDYFFTERLITLDSEVTSAEFRVGIIEDNLIETDELVIAEIISVIGATVPTDQLIASVLLKDDDDPGAAVFTVDDVSQLEGDDNSNALVHTVSLNVDPANLGGSVTVTVMTLNDTATAGVDYTAVNRVLTFLTGESTKTVTIPILGNTLDESAKDVVLELSNAVDANGAAVAIAGTGQGIGSILNDDSTDAVLQVNSFTVREGNSDGETFADFTVSIVGQLGRDVLVDFATEADTAEIDVDFRPVSGTLRFTPGGPTEQTVSVPIVSDTDLEEEFELFVLRLTNARFDSAGSMMNTGTIEIDPDQEQGDGVILDDDRRVFREDGDGQLQIIVGAISDLLDEFSGDRDNPEFLAEMADLNLMALRATGLEFGLVFATDPVDFLLTDTEGRTTGYTASQGEVTEVARSFYSGDGNVELVILPDATAGLFPLQLSGVGSGEFVQVATLVTESGDSQTISNSGVLTGDTQLVLDFTDLGQDNFPTTGEEIFAQLANGDDNSDEADVSNDALAVSTAAMEAVAELQRQQSQEVPGPNDPGAVFRDFLGRVEGLGREVFDAVWNELDSIFAELPETSDSALNAFWAGFGRTLLGTPDGLLDVLDLLELLKDGDDAPASDEPDGDQPADGNADPADADAPEDAADSDGAQAARRERSKSNWLKELVAVAEESPWAEQQPGDTHVRASKPVARATANRPRFVEIARKMQSAEQPSRASEGNRNARQARPPQPPADGS
jgi:hypothetical protein